MNCGKVSHAELQLIADLGAPERGNEKGNPTISPMVRFKGKAAGIEEGQLAFRHGIRHYLILLSICQTCAYRKIEFLDFLRSGEKRIDGYSGK
jgi:hypothetical protein